MAIAEFEATSLETIPNTTKQLRASFNAQTTKPIQYRRKQLASLYWGIKDNEKAIGEACKQDLGRSTFEIVVGEIGWVENDIVFVMKNLKKWMRDEKAPDIDFANSIMKPRIRKDPLGSVLIIGAYNFPIQLTLGPLVGAIAAGCTAVIKPSEVAPACAMVMKMLVEKYLDPNSYACVNGAIPETTALLNEKWDKIFYTGNATVGTIIAKKAAETLTPVVLELGGRNPAFITKHADTRLAARRLLWGKVLNAGQVCISHNYTLVDRDVFDSFIAELKTAMAEFYPEGAKASPDYARIVNNRHFNRLKAMIDNSKGKILIGGTMDEKENFIEPTVVLVDDIEDSTMKDESFGPLMPVMIVDGGLDEMIRISNTIHSTPLGLYPFGTKTETDRILNETRSGGASVNDSFFHGSIPTLAFGGVGDSGQGAYRGRSSFEAFTHRRSVTTTPGWVESLISVRYPPYEGKLTKYTRMATLKPNFDREGHTSAGWLGLLFGLGAKSVVGGLSRWILMLLAAIGIKKAVDHRSVA